MTILAASDAVLITTLIIAAVGVSLTQVGGIIVSVINASRASAAVEKNTEKVQAVHDLVNSAMTEQKRISAMFAKRVAESTKNPKDLALAEEADKIYQEAVANAGTQSIAHPK